jgi:hypothetical protein
VSWARAPLAGGQANTVALSSFQNSGPNIDQVVFSPVSGGDFV